MNPLLANIIENTEKHVPPKDADEFHRIVLAGKKLIFDPKFHQNMELVKNPASRQDPVHTISNGVVGLMWMLYIHSNKSLHPTPLIMAGCIFMCEVYDFAERSFNIQVTNDVVANTWELTMDNMMKKLGVTQEALQTAINQNAAKLQNGQQQAPQEPQAVILNAGQQGVQQ